MTRTHTNRRLGLALAGLVAATVAATVFGAAGAFAKADVPDVPSTIAVEPGHKLFLVGHAVGVQIYRCDPTASGAAWTFVAPRADVYDDKGKLLVTHFAGPTWLAKDGSFALGSVVDRAPMAGSIPLLLLATSTDEGDGRLSATTFVQRLATTGGLAPAAAECTAATVGTVAEVPYTADYTFWKATGGA
jgi:hypothetical protein